MRAWPIISARTRTNSREVFTDDLAPVARMKLQLHQHVEVGGSSTGNGGAHHPTDATKSGFNSFTTRGLVEVSPPRYEEGISEAARAAVDAFCLGSPART